IIFNLSSVFFKDGFFFHKYLQYTTNFKFKQLKLSACNKYYKLQATSLSLKLTTHHSTTHQSTTHHYP
ncbi:MAG: hypothetical protein SCK70_05530, partial [bacterium]|nr:hypothetical protein [bacterium]